MDTTNTEDYMGYYKLTVVSCCFFLAIFKILSPALCSAFIPGYNKLSPNKKIEWDLRITSTSHSLLTTNLAIYALLFDEISQNDLSWGDSTMIRTTSSIVCGYILADAIAILVYWKAVGEVGYVFHHFAVLWAYYFVVTDGVLCWFANFRLLAEMSTPYVNNRWFFDTLEVARSTNSFVINGVVMALTFFLSRIVAIPPYWYKVYSIYDTPQYYTLGNMFLVMCGSSLILDGLNIFWFQKIVKGVSKVVLDTKRQHFERRVA